MKNRKKIIAMKNCIKFLSAALLTLSLSSCGENIPAVSETTATAFENHTIMPKIVEAEEDTETERPETDPDWDLYEDKDYIETRENDEYEYKVYTNYIVLTHYLGDEEIIEIPSEIDGLKVTKIGDWAFNSHKSITKIEIPESVTEILEFAFNNCTNLAEISMPENVDIGDYAFSGTAWIKNQSQPLIINSKLILWDTAEGDVVIPDGITKICGAAFYKCRDMTSVTIPDSVKEIGGSSFQDCGLLKSVTIPNGVEIIGNFAFARCEALEEIIIPESVTKIKSQVFMECYKLKNVTIPDSFDNAVLQDAFGDTYWYKKLCDETYVEIRKNEEYKYDVYEKHIVILEYLEYDEQLDIPAEIDGISVTEIGESAFNFKGIINVTIPDGITKIGASAFEYTDLTEVTVPESVTVLGEYAFSSCEDLTDVTVPEHFDKETIKAAFLYTPWYEENYGE